MSKNGTFGLVADALGPGGRRRLGLLALLTVLGSVAEFGSLAALAALLKGWLASGGDELPRHRLTLFAVAILAAGGLRMLLLSATQSLAFGTGHRLLVAVQRRVLARDWQTHAQARSSGPVAATHLVEQWLFGGLLPLLQGAGAAVLGAGILAGLLWIDPRAAIAAGLLLGGLFVVATLLVRGSVRNAGEALGRDYDERVAAIQENVGALRELILAGARHAAAERVRAIDQRLTSARIRLAVVGGLPRILVESVGVIALALLAAWLAGRPGGLTAALPTLAALALGAQRLLPQLQSISQAYSAWSGSVGIHRRLAAMLAGPDLDEGHAPPPLAYAHAIELKSVSFAYDGRDQPVLADIDLTIAKSERIALTGRNGSGKSTLADLVMGLLVPGAGRILIDGVELTPERLRAWQRNVAHVPQAPFLLDGSVAENIAFMAADPDHIRVVDAARRVGLHDFIAGLARGYETRVGERGQLLSGGQRQRLALARALYSPAPLLVLDEATSALDPETERNVLEALDRLQAAGTTILLIAHRPAMIERCDRVIHLVEGRIAAD